MKNRSNKNLMGMAVIFLVISLTVFFFVYKKLNQNKQAAESTLKEWQKEDTRLTELKTLDATLKSMEAERKNLDKHFAKSTDAVPFLDSLEASARSVGAKAEISAVEIPKEEQVLNVTLKATGSFEALYKFLLLVENAPYELQITTMNIVKNGGEDTLNTNGSWQVFIKLKLLSFLK